MLALIITAFSTFADEVQLSIGKRETTRGVESLYSMGFLSTFLGTLLLIAVTIFVPKDFFAPGFPGVFIFSAESLPTFLPRFVFEIVLAYLNVLAIRRADRSTYGFFRILTIPLLLIVDIVLGYAIGNLQIFGMGLIIVTLVLLYSERGIRREGVGIVLATAMGAVLTISLYKYDITHFNSVAAEQSIVGLGIVVFFFFMAKVRAKENPFALLRHPIIFLQALCAGSAGVGLSFAMLYGSASVITTLYRALSVLFAMLAGHLYFREQKLWVKALAFLGIAGGLLLLASTI